MPQKLNLMMSGNRIGLIALCLTLLAACGKKPESQGAAQASLAQKAAALDAQLASHAIDPQTYAKRACALAKEYLDTKTVPVLIRYTEAKRLCETGQAQDPANEETPALLKRIEAATSAMVE